MEKKRLIYNWWHLHAAIKCLQAGRPDNAVDWINRDLGELYNYPDCLKHYADPESLQLEKDGTISYEEMGDPIEYYI